MSVHAPITTSKTPARGESPACQKEERFMKGCVTKSLSFPEWQLYIWDSFHWLELGLSQTLETQTPEQVQTPLES